MWTQNGNVEPGGRNDECGIVSGKGVIYVDKIVGPHTQSHGFPSSTTLDLNG